jgi:hypothetical protein
MKSFFFFFVSSNGKLNFWNFIILKPQRRPVLKQKFFLKKKKNPIRPITLHLFHPWLTYGLRPDSCIPPSPQTIILSSSQPINTTCSSIISILQQCLADCTRLDACQATRPGGRCTTQVFVLFYCPLLFWTSCIGFVGWF